MGCSRRSAWLSAFLSFQVLGFTACLVAVVTPTWQYVYLEDGRTEHHHGLWLDCKRDYSSDYGRTKEYYQTLYRLDHLQGPFDQFWLPPLLCVYKFDYWLDDEDWYEHGYDENRLQGDAYQHLFIGWKIAALTAHCFGLICSLTAIIILFCAFCHRLLICVSAVLVSLSVITVSIGNAVFYMFANYQDNNILHEDDGDYEQYFGWSFYAALFGNFLLLCSSIIGCMATSAVLTYGKTKLVKIELGEQDRDQLLHSSTGTTSMNPSSFKRSLSAVYKIDSTALRKWEKEQMRSVQKQQQFKRANSMPNIVKKSAMRQSNVLSSQSDLSSHAQTEPIDNIKLAWLDPLHPGPQHQRTITPIIQAPILRQPSDEVIYEYVEPHSISFVSEKSAPYSSDRRPPLPKRPGSSTALPVYDQVFDTPRSTPINGSPKEEAENEYLKPIQSGSSTPVGIPIMKQKPLQQQETQFTSMLLTRQEIEERFERTNLHGFYGRQQTKPSQNIRKPNLPKLPPKPAIRSSLRALTRPKEPVEDTPGIVKINTFQYRDENGRIRSLTNLSMGDQVPEPPPVTSFFSSSRSPTEIASSVNNDDQSSSTNSYASSLRNRLMPGLKETNFDSLLARKYASSEADRSVGSSTIYRPQSPSYELDDDRSTVSTNLSSGSGNGRPTVATNRPSTNSTMV